MAKPFGFMCFLYQFILLSFSSSSLAQIIGILNSPSFATSTPSHPWQRLNQVASASLARAHYIKFPTTFPTAMTNISPRSFGLYTLSLNFGTPPQTLAFLLDTGSSVTWFPCTQHFNCSDCYFKGINPANISSFIPTLSTSAKIIDCSKSPERHPLHGNNSQLICKDCCENFQNCTQNCPYSVTYGLGSTSGFLLSETLHFPNKDVTNFTVGCSTKSSNIPYGIVGFGRNPLSLPSQMGLKKFSYCLVSHKFDDTAKSSQLIMVTGGDSNYINNLSRIANMSYTPFAKAPKRFGSAYYVNLTKITVGGVEVKVPYKYVVPGLNGNGGTVVDSGSTFTVMDNEIFEMVVKEFEKQMVQYHRVSNGSLTQEFPLSPCYNVSGENLGNFPVLNFYFEGGAKMAVPMSDKLEPHPDVVCLTIVSAQVLSFSGPSIILGNYQQQNLYMEFDLENQRLGFRKQVC